VDGPRARGAVGRVKRNRRFWSKPNIFREAVGAGEQCNEKPPSSGDRLLFYRHDMRVAPERIHPFLKESLKLFALCFPPGATGDATG
jgi:hypothetical protein